MMDQFVIWSLKGVNGINYATGLPVNLFGYDTKEFLQKQHK